MYSRAPRTLGQINGQTPYHVGPGSYDPKKQGKALDAYAPFLSLAARDDIFTSLTAAPGPAQYDLRQVSQTVKGGSTLANRASRFKEYHDELPGPGAYTIENPQVKTKATSLQDLRLIKPKFDIQRKKNPPSIQDPKYAYGFEENNLGELIPQEAPTRDPSLGPAYYSIKESRDSYKGVHFSKYASKRTNFAAKAGPGPGEYDTTDPVHVDVLHYNIKLNEKKPDLVIPRFTEVVIKNAEKESVPGPGKYDTKRLFDGNQNKMMDDNLEFDRPPFGVQSKRFHTFKSVAPGPGAYNEPRTALISLNKIKGMKNTPFAQSSTRFGSTNQSRSAPGPGQYKIPGFADENLRKMLINGSSKPGFGQSSIRKFNQTKRDEYLTPGPAQYQIKQKPFRPRQENLSSNFASTSKREAYVEDTPGPTDYDVTNAFENLVKLKREKPRSKEAQKRQESFNFASRRFDNGQTIDEDALPGPATYDTLHDPLKKGRNFAKQYERRWKTKKVGFPGPADYEMSTAIQDTLLKGTFNVTLNNPILAKERITKSLVYAETPNFLQVS